MAIKPMLFNTEMVRAILDGRKRCTRRKIPIDIVNNLMNAGYNACLDDILK